jgi:GTP pyrophosphokinase
LGKEFLKKDIRDYGFDPFQELNEEALAEASHACGFNSTEGLFVGIGIGKLSTHHVLEKLLPKEKLEGKTQRTESLIKLKENKPPNFIKVQCLNDHIMIRIGKCCHPLPGEPIVGYLTRGRGVTVHHIDCPSVCKVIDDSERGIGVEWNTGSKTTYQAHIAIIAADNPGIFASIGHAFAEGGINLTRANVQQGAHKRAYFDLSIEIHDVEHLNQMLEKIRQVEGVIYLERMKEFNKNSPVKNRLEAMGGKLKPNDDNKLTVD